MRIGTYTLGMRMRRRAHAWARSVLCFGGILVLASCKSNGAGPASAGWSYALDVRTTEGSSAFPVSAVETQWNAAAPAKRKLSKVDEGVQPAMGVTFADQIQDADEVALFLRVDLKPGLVSLPSPQKFGLVVDREALGQAASRDAALHRLFSLFWLSVDLSETGLPAARRALQSEYREVQMLAAQWVVEHASNDVDATDACLSMIARGVSLAPPDYEFVEIAAACVGAAGTQADVPRLLDAIPLGDARLTLHRIEALGELGGDLAQVELRMVLDNEDEGPLRSAARRALQQIDPSVP